MKPIAISFFTLCLALLFSACQQGQPPSEIQNPISPSSAEGDIIPDQYIFVFKKEAIKPVRDYFSMSDFANREEKIKLMTAKSKQVKAEITSFLQKHRVNPQSVIRTYTAATAGVRLKLDKTTYERLILMNEFESVEYDRHITLPYYEEKHIESSPPRGQHQSCAVDYAGTHNAGTTRWIWIVDTGIDTNHPDLNVYTTYAHDATGNNDYEDPCGHGSHVAGIAAAKNNSIGIVGVAAGAPVIPVKVFTTCKTFPSSPSYTLAGIDHVILHAWSGDVVNLSFGSKHSYMCSQNSVYKSNLDALSDDGVWVAIAAGNSSILASKYSPACINNTKLLTVASMKCNGKFSKKFSNYGLNPVDYIAAGYYIKSCNHNGGYTRMTGTSMAAPIVAGICQLNNNYPFSNGTVSYKSQSYPIASAD